MILTMVVEMPMGSTWKYEEDKRDGRLVLDRPLNQPVPYNYGYIEGGNLCDDGDPIDCFVLTDTPIYPLARVKVEIISVIKCLDNGKRDDKLIGLIVGEYIDFRTVGVGIIQKYLETYKEGFEILGIGTKEEAVQIYEDSVKMYKNNALNELAKETETLGLDFK